MSDHSAFDLLLDSIFQRLERIEQRLGITERLPIEDALKQAIKNAEDQ